MQTTNRVFDDFARFAGGAVGVLAGMKDEVEARIRQRVEEILDGMNLVNRDEFDAVKEMAALARSENDRLARRIVALEMLVGEAKKQPRKPRKKLEPRKDED